MEEMHDHYTSPELIAETGHAKVFRVTKNDRKFLLKVPKEATGTLASMIRREYELSSLLQHPYIASVFEFAKDTPVGSGIVMENVEGRTLKEYLCEKHSLKERRRIFDQILDAAGFIHRNGFVHNGLKPENIFITSKGDNVKLVCLGLPVEGAQLSSDTDEASEYLAPEIKDHVKTIDSRSDIYSIGKLMGDLFGGKFGGIASRCANKKRNKRFRRVEQIIDAFHGRNRPWKFFRSVLVAGLIAAPSYFAVQQQITLHEKNHTLDSLRTALSHSFNKLDSLKLMADDKLIIRDSINDMVDRRLEEAVTLARIVIDTTKDISIARDAIQEHIGLSFWVDSLCRTYPEELAAMVQYHYQQSYFKCVDRLERILDTKWGLSEQKEEVSGD